MWKQIVKTKKIINDMQLPYINIDAFLTNSIKQTNKIYRLQISDK